ncbi:MAG: hypothetical protein IK120_09960 [Muribaculaceae bacterium]|nr:hypothetical protein [Muribaculaceae bacterium]
MLAAVVVISTTTAVADPVDSLNETHSDFNESDEFIEEYSALYDSLKDEKLKSLLSKIRIKHEIAEKKAAIADQQEDIANKNRNLVFLSIVAIVAIIFAAVATFFFIKYRRLAKEEHKVRRNRERLLSLISHEIRSPLITLMTSLKMLKNTVDEDDKEVQGVLNNIMSSISNQLQMASNLLSWGKLQIGALPNNKIKFDAVPLIDEAEKLVKEPLANKSISLLHDIPDRHIFVFADRQMLFTILRNLIHNAIKYSNIGENVIVKIRREGDFYAFYVIDTGIGVKPEMADQLFNSTVKSSVGTSGETGVGYGLRICDAFAKQCGGTISLAPEHRINEKGTAFKVTIPAAKTEES